jgi:hypothetical protein
VTELFSGLTLVRTATVQAGPVRADAQLSACSGVATAHPPVLLRAVLNGSSKDDRDNRRRDYRRGLRVHLLAAGRVLDAVYYEMLTCERCGASYPACGWCPFCNPRGSK